MTSEEIKELRERLGMTQTEFAREIGVSLPSVSNWETGDHSPDRRAQKQLQRLVRKVGAG